MAVEGIQTCWTFVAGGDLSAKQFQFVKLNSSGQVIICAAATDIPIGVLQDKSASAALPDGTYGSVLVCLFGLTKIVAGATVAKADAIGTDSAGKAVPYVAGTDTTKYPVGQAWIGASSTNYASVFINCLSPHRGA